MNIHLPSIGRLFPNVEANGGEVEVKYADIYITDDFDPGANPGEVFLELLNVIALEFGSEEIPGGRQRLRVDVIDPPPE